MALLSKAVDSVGKESGTEEASLASLPLSLTGHGTRQAWTSHSSLGAVSMDEVHVTRAV